MKQIKIPAEITLALNSKPIIKGKLSVLEGLFTPNKTSDNLFVPTGCITFIYNEVNFSFEAKNIGGKYFVQDYKNNVDYQKVISMIKLNETLAVNRETKSTARPKL